MSLLSRRAGRLAFACVGGLLLAGAACNGPAFTIGPSDGGGALGSSLPVTDLDADGSHDASAPASSLAGCTMLPCVLANYQPAPIDVVLTAAGAYWANFGTSKATPAYSDGSISQYALSAGKPAVLILNQAHPTALAVTLVGMVWVGGDPLSAYSGTLEGKVTASTVLPLETPISMVIGSGLLYLASLVPKPSLADASTLGSSVSTLPLALQSAVPMPLQMSSNVVPQVAFNGTDVFWTEIDLSATGSTTEGGLLFKYDTTKHTVTTLATGLASPFAIWADATDVFFSTIGPTAMNVTGAIMRKSLASGAGAPTVVASTSAPVHALTGDGKTLYWAEYASSGNVFRTDSPTTSPITTMIASGQAYPRSIAANAAYVVWANGGTNTTPTSPTSQSFDDGDGSIVGTLSFK